MLASSFLWTRGYTTVWSGWENNLGPLTGLTATAVFPIAHGPGNATMTGPAYEYIVTGGSSFALSYPAASGSQGAPDAVLTHRVHLNDPPQVVPNSGWAYTDASRTAIKVDDRKLRQQRYLRVLLHREGPDVNGLGLAAIRDFNSFLRYSTRDDFGISNPIHRLRRPDLHRNFVPARPDAQRLRPSGVQ